jgi:hypothetical protein
MSSHASTGPGRLSVNPNAASGGIRAVMSNFDIDVDTPKAEHINFLNTRVLPLILSRRARIWLQGGASSTGTAAHNMALSRRRADSVARYLESRGVPGNQLQIDAVGEGFATTTPAENADDRAVSLLAAPLLAPPPPTPTPPSRPAATPTPTATAFRVRLVGASVAARGSSPWIGCTSRSGIPPTA